MTLICDTTRTSCASETRRGHTYLLTLDHDFQAVSVFFGVDPLDEFFTSSLHVVCCCKKREKNIGTFVTESALKSTISGRVMKKQNNVGTAAGTVIA